MVFVQRQHTILQGEQIVKFAPPEQSLYDGKSTLKFVTDTNQKVISIKPDVL
jgi:hypothetical protein